MAALDHPPHPTFPDYPQMIMGAIEEMNQKEGMSKDAIIDFIECNYTDLPPTNTTHVIHTLEKLKQTGQLVLKNGFYTLKPADAAEDDEDDEDDDGPTNGLSLPMKRGRGRPPKPKVPLPPGVDPPTPRPRGRPPKPRDALSPATTPNKPVSSGRPRGRPKKSPGVEANAVEPTTTDSGVKRGRGRPKKV